MPLRGRSALTEPSVFFVTSSTRDWIEHFADPVRMRMLQNTIFAYARSHQCRLFGYCLMPNHFHMLVYVPGGGPALSKLMKAIKSVTARALEHAERPVWQHRFDDLVIISRRQFTTKLNYIHENPVRAGLCASPESWPYSSAQAWATREPIAGLEFDFDFLDNSVR